MNIENIGHSIGVVAWIIIAIIIAFIGMSLNKVNVMAASLLIIFLTMIWYITTLPALFKK